MPPKFHALTIDVDGKQETGYYTLKDGTVTVKTLNAQKSTALSGFEPALVASWLLRELVTEERHRKS